MNQIKKWMAAWQDDPRMGRILRNTGMLFSSNTISLGLSVAQSILAARLLGVELFGVLGTITVFASTINRLFSFRMGELVVRYVSAYLTDERPDKAAAVVKAALLAEALTTVVAFIFLVFTARLGAQVFAKDVNFTPYFLVYGISVLGSLVVETSTGILQVDNRFRSQATVNLAQSALTALVIAVAYITNAGLWLVLAAYLIGKMILGIAPAVLAWGSLKRLLPQRWWTASFDLLPPRRELVSFAMSTNMSATINLLVRDSELLWVAFFLSPLEAGYYKVALAIINLTVLPITPFISTTYPEISRTVAEKRWSALRNLLKRVTALSAGWIALVTVGLALFGKWLIGLYGWEYLPAYPAMMVLLVGTGFANIFFWNRPLLLAFGKPAFTFRAALVVGLLKMSLAFPLVPRFGNVAEAALLSGYHLFSGGAILLRGLGLIKERSRLRPEAEAEE
ncbi:MAG: oligosaccharide flippase family protein [Anaerolineae bacterium]|nr:oligosaccharide flippase family protein [Anaerolineae bacterium]